MNSISSRNSATKETNQANFLAPDNFGHQQRQHGTPLNSMMAMYDIRHFQNPPKGGPHITFIVMCIYNISLPILWYNNTSVTSLRYDIDLNMSGVRVDEAF